MKQVAVIILNWNGEKLLKRYLPHVIQHTNPDIADVIVADNGSTDGSLALLNAEFPQVKTLVFDQNYGYAEGYNKAIAGTSYDYTVLLNSDVRTSPHWLEPLLDHMQKHPEVAACQPKIICDEHPEGYPDDSEIFEYAGAAGGFIDSHAYPYCRGRIFGVLEPDNGQYDTAPLPIFWATGACLMVRSDVYNNVGGLDKHFFAHMEEIDLCWRIHLAGYEICAISDSKIYHLGGGSLPAGNPRKTYLNFRNNLLLMHKNLPKRDARKMLFIRRLYDTLSIGMFLAKLQWKNAWAVVKAHRDFATMRKRYPQNATVNLLKSFPGCEINVVLQHFLLRRTKFTQLKR